MNKACFIAVLMMTIIVIPAGSQGLKHALGAGLGLNLTTVSARIDTMHRPGNSSVMSLVFLDGKIGAAINSSVSLYLSDKLDMMCPYSQIIIQNGIGPELFISIDDKAIGLFGGFSYWAYPFSKSLNDSYGGIGIQGSTSVRIPFRKMVLVAEYSFAANTNYGVVQGSGFDGQPYTMTGNQTYFVNGLKCGLVLWAN